MLSTQEIRKNIAEKYQIFSVCGITKHLWVLYNTGITTAAPSEGRALFFSLTLTLTLRACVGPHSTHSRHTIASQ